LDASVWLLIHAPPQHVRPLGHPADVAQTQVLFEQLWPAAHLLPQAPQLFASLVRLTQAVPPQQTFPSAQGAPPLPHGVTHCSVWPDGHVCEPLRQWLLRQL